MKFEEFTPEKQGPEDKIEKIEHPEQKELLELNREKLVNQEETLLAKFRGKARNIAKALTLVTALTVTPGLIRAAETEEEEEQEIEYVGPEKEPEKGVYTITFDKNKEISPEIVENIDMVYLYVINDKEAKPIVLSQQDLKKSPRLNIDGYITNIIVFCKDKANVKLNRKGFKKIEIRSFEGKNYVSMDDRCIYPSNLKTEKYGEETFQRLFARESIKGKKGHSFLKGGYFLGETPHGLLYLGSAINNRKNNKLKFISDDKTYTIDINQKKFQKFKRIDLDPTQSRDNVVFHYLGNAPDEFSQVQQVDEKLQAIAQGINNVETISNNNFVSRVNMIDYEEVNAFAEHKKKLITFLSQYLELNSVKDAQLTAEHETLHKYVFEKGFTQDKQIRKIFADLKGYTGHDKETLIDQGWIPFDNFNMDYENKAFFSFINEMNFFEASGGHSNTNVYEFCTSFFHTLMDIEWLEQNLEKPLRIRMIDIERTMEIQRRGELKLSEQEKVSILDNYITVLEVMIKSAESIPVIGPLYENADEKFLKDKLEHVKEVKAKYEQQS